MPKVSVIMPCFNHGQFVGAAIESILAQSFDNFELIVVDDASSDNSVEVIREFVRRDTRVRLILRDGARGASRSRNAGLLAAGGEYIAFCDADDLWKPDKLQRQVNLLDEHRDYDLTYCESEIIDADGQPTGRMFSDEFPLPSVPSGDLFEVLCARNFINTQTVLARRQALGRLLLFDESLKWVEDWWQWIRLSRHHRFLYEPRALAWYRVHPQSSGATQRPGILKNRWKVYKRNLRAHGDMELRIQAVIWYQMGLMLCLTGRRRSGCQFISQALRHGWNGGLSPRRLAKMSLRLVLECSRGMMSTRHRMNSKRT